MKVFAGLHIRPMVQTDINDAMRLKEFAHWNQTPTDWEGLMAVEPEGCFVGEWDGVMVATATAVNYENRFGWIGMILVDPEYRRRGIATQMMRQTMDFLKSQACTCQKLDATDAGAQVYEKIGFVAEYPVERWNRPQGRRYSAPALPGGIRPFSERDLERVDSWDREIFGASRRRLLKRYLDNGFPCFLVESRNQLSGFIMGRPGSNAFHIGPLTAGDPDTAGVLLAKVLAPQDDQPVIADFPVANPDAKRILESAGFERSRVLQRMVRGPNRHPGRPRNVFCLAGFEYG